MGTGASEAAKSEWVRRVLGVVYDGDRPAASGPEIWRTAVTAVTGQLRSVIAAVRATQDPEAGQVEVILRSIAANLSGTPDSPQAIEEMRRYLEEDDVVAAAEEVPAKLGRLDLRKPLLRALEALAV